MSKASKCDCIPSNPFWKLLEGTECHLLIEPVKLQKIWEEAVANTSLEDDSIYWNKEVDQHLFVPGNVFVMYEQCVNRKQLKIQLKSKSCGGWYFECQRSQHG